MYGREKERVKGCVCVREIERVSVWEREGESKRVCVCERD